MSNWPKPHHGMVAEYQASGIPFVTSSASGEAATTPIQIKFPYVTRWVQVFNTDTNGDLRVGFTQNGVNASPTKNCVVLNKLLSTVRWEIKCTSIWLRNDTLNSTFSVIAGLTNVPSGDFFLMSGSNGVAGVG